MRALFVDDEARVLEALERVLFDVASDWETRFVTSTDAALAELDKRPYDVIVSDLRMPGRDGVALLTRVAELYPRTVRIVLSGHSDEEAALKMVHVAHQFLAKPCTAETVHQVIARAADLTRLLPDRKLQTLAGQAGSLPCSPRLQRQLLELMQTGNDAPSAEAMARLIKQDPGMTSKLLQVASSAFFNSASSVTDVESAIMRLGFRTLRNLAHSFAVVPAAAHAAVQRSQERALHIARVAAGMARLPEDAAAAYIAGLLCDVGQLALITASPERLYLSQAEAAQRGVADHLAERAIWGATHAEIGAYLLGLWGLPFQIVQAVANHHAPERSQEDRGGLTQLVWLASCIVDAEEPAPDSLSRFGLETQYAAQRAAFSKERA
jgi:HD-like signal output (HDOD) protein/CheY-like chemotaxis protein